MEPRRERPPVALQRHFGLEKLGDGRQHVDVLRERRDDAPRVASNSIARVAHDEGHVERLVEPAELVHDPVVAERLAMVGGEHHQRAGREARRVEHVEDAADLIVDLGHHAVVGRLELALFVRVVGRRDERVIDHQVEQRVLRALFGAGCGAHGLGYRRRVEHRVVGSGREKRRVGPEVRNVREPRLAGTCPVVDEVEQPIREIRGLGVLGVVLRAPTGALGRPVDERAPVVGHVDAGQRASSRATPRGRPRGGSPPRRSREAHLRRYAASGRRARRYEGRCCCRCIRRAPARSPGTGRPRRRWCGGRRGACR